MKLFSRSYNYLNTNAIKRRKTDLILLFCVMALLLLGIVMVYSASMYNAEVNYGNRFYYMYKQIFGVILGLCSMTALYFVDYHKLAKWKYIILAVSLLLLVLVFIPGIGVENYGAKRWIKFPFFTLQPSEITKFAYIIFCAGYFSKYHDKVYKFVYLLPIIGFGGLICVLIMLEPNMSVTMCVAITMCVMLFIGGTKLKHFAYILAPLAAAVPVLILAEPYRLSRLTAFLDPWASPLGEGYQLIQSLYALGSGGFFGVGLFCSRQKYLFLPFSESDFIFSVIGEELGLFGCGIVILLYVIIVVRAIKIAQRSMDRLGSYLAGGIAALLAVQVLINIAVVSGSIPPTGLPLPFVSAGSSSLIAFCGGIGILLNISKQSEYYL